MQTYDEQRQALRDEWSNSKSFFDTWKSCDRYVAHKKKCATWEVTDSSIELWRMQWARTRAVAVEFTSAEEYAAFKMAGGQLHEKTPLGVSSAQIEAWRDEWYCSAALQQEFPDITAYFGFKKAEATGTCHIIRGAAWSSGSAQPPRRHVSERQMQAWKHEWEDSVELQSEFPTAESYAGFKQGEALGRCRVFGGA